MRIAIGFIFGWLAHRFVAWLDAEAEKCLSGTLPSWGSAARPASLRLVVGGETSPVSRDEGAAAP